MKKYAKRIYLCVVFAILYIPILTLILFSFNDSESTANFTGFSLDWYTKLFSDENAFIALRNTIILAVSSALLSTVIGTAAAEGIYRMRSKWFKTVVTSVTNVPMMNPDIVTGVSFMLFFAAVVGLFQIADYDSIGFAAMLIAHTTFCLPYVILNVLPRINELGESLSEAALDLGCTPVQAFFKVKLPNIMPGVISGMVMAFTLSLDDFVISYFVSGPEFQTLPIRIYSMTKKRVTPDMYALSTIIFLVMLILLIALNVIQNRAENGSLRNREKVAK
jgi:spermidine/putrescine transport system permease protein